ncbi:probable RNA-binding protein CG14230 [Thrips palmi]|uniref:Probable RNA-binding protein CG14230 n=1 Tax=Thrips palmi TaxID=161013 RepID=A0A6P8ZKB2_THRPL|nr:probable RNA-binding protein CG14230 [Thrips palmi]
MRTISQSKPHGLLTCDFVVGFVCSHFKVLITDMSAQSHRIFVGNLPHAATEEEIRSKFIKYGTVESVEIRTKKDACTGDPLATFSFVNIKADRESLSQSALLVNGIKIGGRNIKVELAKESFLQRLQRERQAGNKTAPPSVPSHPQPSAYKKSTDNFKNKSVPKEADCEDNDVKFHPTSKLPMFKGVSLQISDENKSEVQVEKEVSSFSNTNRSDNNSRSDKRSSKNQFQSQNSDILKKFESFSDVWKDDDGDYQEDYSSSSFKQGDKRQSYQDDFNGPSKFSQRDKRHSYQDNNGSLKFRHGDKRQSSEKFSYTNKAGSWQSQDQLYQRNGSGAGGSSGSTKPSVNAAEEKRLKSLDEKRQTFEQQKNAIKLALSSESASKVNKKVVFGDDDEPTGLYEKQLLETAPKGQKQTALTLFNESDDEAAPDDWKNQFEVRKQFQGEKGKKLLQLQSNFNNDERFKLDQRFYEDGGETNSKPSEKPETKTVTSEDGVDTVEGTEGLAEEREQQLQILSDILGQSIPTTQPPVHRESKRIGMLRFDPSKPNHVKYELSKEPKEKKRKKKKKEGEEEDDDDDEIEEESSKRKFRREEKEPEPVSESKFYNISGTLADTLKQSKEGESSGFSLLQMFGSPSVPSEKHENETVPRVKPLRKNLKQSMLDDSSSDEEGPGPTADLNAADNDKAFPTSNPGIRSSHGVWQESFFLQSGDTRLKEGLDFFSVNKRNDTVLEPQKRHEILRCLMRHKRRLKKEKDMMKPKPRSVQHSNKASSRKVNIFKPRRKVK